MKLSIGVVLFEGFELLDVFGPLEMFGLLPEHFEIDLLAENMDPIASAQGPRSLPDDVFSADQRYDIILVPGGQGTRTQINNAALLDWLIAQSTTAQYVTSVCTGSALLAKSGLLDGRNATSNKASFQWVVEQGKAVHWIKQARWVEDGPFFTSSGVSAGIDMSLALIERILGRDISHQTAIWAEYERQTDSEQDPFAKYYDQTL